MVSVLRRLSLCLLVLFAYVANVHADPITFKFVGTIDSIVDASAEGEPPIDFTPAPVGSSFSGTITYDVNSPATDGGTGYTRFVDMLSSNSSLTLNGFTFASVEPTEATVVSQEAGFGFSGINFSSQPISLPAGWSVGRTTFPYFTVRFWDAITQFRSQTLPANAASLPGGNMELILDFQQPVTIGQSIYGGRVFITGTVSAVNVVPPPQEVEIDIDPPSTSNKINLNSNNPKPLEVAVYGAADFDVLRVEPGTIQLGDPALTEAVNATGHKIAPSSVQYRDVDRDGELDLLLTFSLKDLESFGAINSSSKSLKLQALLDNDGIVFGSDLVSIQGAKGKAK
jgi:hypothetical protein